MGRPRRRVATRPGGDRTWSPVTVWEVSVIATSAISAIPDHSNGASTRRCGPLAARQRAARTQITAPASATAATLVKTSPMLPSVVELVTWMTLSGQRSHAWIPDSRIGSAPARAQRVDRPDEPAVASAAQRAFRIREQQVHEHAEVEVRRQHGEREDRGRVRGHERVRQPQEAGPRHQRADPVGRAAVPGEQAGRDPHEPDADHEHGREGGVLDVVGPGDHGCRQQPYQEGAERRASPARG